MYKPKRKFTIWLDNRLPIIRFFHKHLFSFKVPKDLNYFYSFGGILIIMLLSQLLTGLVMAIHYIAYVNEAFASIEIFSRSGSLGWLFHPWHTIGSSFFFIAVYIHIARSLYYKSYQGGKGLNWGLGVFCYLLMLIIAFLGYTLSWGQMSWMAVTVVSNFFTAVPIIGENLKVWFLGGYEISQYSLNRFYTFHYFLTFVLILIILLHIIAVHTTGQTGSKDNLSFHKAPPVELVNFYPYYWIKDLFAICIFLLFFCWFLFYIPDYMGGGSNFMPVNPLIPPKDIIVEWHILPFYAMLKAVPFNIGSIAANKLGVYILVAALVILFFVPVLDKQQGGATRNILLSQKIFFWLFIINFISMGYLGTQKLAFEGELILKLMTIYYFSYFLIILPLFSYLRKRNLKNAYKKS
ncbi:cytochrome bc complex cytochrome b subunit [Bartonella sp. DGB1]|uniref:cytochrome b n=1 Tax=Bartonella sp. DGB1 TaxID=3239807 RepID=UPI003523B8CF